MQMNPAQHSQETTRSQQQAPGDFVENAYIVASPAWENIGLPVYTASEPQRPVYMVPPSPDPWQQTSLLTTPPPPSSSLPTAAAAAAAAAALTSAMAHLRTAAATDDHCLEEIVFSIFVPHFQFSGIKSRAFCVFLAIRTMSPPFAGHGAYQVTSNPEHRAAFARYVTTCVRCLDQGITDGYAAIEFLHYCYGDGDVADEKILNIPRVCCFTCARDSFGVQLPYEQAAGGEARGTEEEANLLLSRSVCTTVLTTAFGNFTRGIIEQAVDWCRDNHVVRQRAESISRRCACCSVSVPSALETEQDDGICERTAAQSATNRRAIDEFMGSSVFGSLRVESLVRILDEYMRQPGNGQTPVYGFLENLANALVETTRSAGADNLQVRKPFGLHAYQYRNQPGLFRFPKRFCSSLCEQTHQYAVSEVQRRTLAGAGYWTADAESRQCHAAPAVVSHHDILRRYSLVHLQHMFLSAVFSRAVSGSSSSSSRDSDFVCEAFLGEMDAQLRQSNARNQLCCWCRRHFGSGSSSADVVWGSRSHGTQVFCYCGNDCELAGRQVHAQVYQRYRAKPVTDLYTWM